MKPLKSWMVKGMLGVVLSLAVILLSISWSGAAGAWDLSSSHRSGSYPWEGTPVYEEIAVVKLPSAPFNEELMGLISTTSLAQAFTAPLELRPILTASVVAQVLEETGDGSWRPVQGDPNPILQPIFTMLLGQFSGNLTQAQALGRELSTYPLMMPDSAGSAVLELRNSGFETPFLDRDLHYAVIFPFKVGFWVEGDYLHVDILNPEAVVQLVLGAGDGGEERDGLMDLARRARDGLVEAVWDSLSLIFAQEDLLLRRVPLPPYLPGQSQVTGEPWVEIGSAASEQPLGDVVKEVLASTAPGPEGETPLFQTYGAFDGISGMLKGALEHPTDPAAWVPTPDGQVADDVMYLNGVGQAHPDRLPFIRSILTPLFQHTFLLPRGSSLEIYHNSQGVEVVMADVGSPYYGQILLRMGGHRAPGTPCKLMAYEEGGAVHLFTIDPLFMFQALFGDTHPEAVTQWDGAFEWPYGMGLDALGQEAGELFAAYSGMALTRMGLSTGVGVELSPEARRAMEEVFPDVQ